MIVEAFEVRLRVVVRRQPMGLGGSGQKWILESWRWAVLGRWRKPKDVVKWTILRKEQLV